MNHHESRRVDEGLRDVPVPDGLAGRVRPDTLFDDAAIDRLLARVEPPRELATRVRRAVSATRGGATPRSARPLAGGGRRRPGAGPADRWRRAWQIAIDVAADGASVAAALAIVTGMFVAGTVISRRLAPGDEVAATVPQAGDGPRKSTGERPASPPRTAVAGASAAGQAEGPDVAATSGGMPPAADHGRTVRAAERAPDTTTAGSPAEVAAASPGRRPVGSPDRGPGDALEVRASPVAAAAGEAGRRGPSPPIRAVFLPPAPRQVPRSPGFDLAFEMAHGESPFVDPAVAPALAVDRPPLTLRADSYDALLDLVGNDRGRAAARRARRTGLPPPRTEEILAALPPHLPSGAKAGRGLSLSLQAVRSLRSAPDSLLVEVEVTAASLADLASESTPAVDCLLVLDQSTGPFASPSWRWMCRGLARVVAQMRPVDRLSVVVCGEVPRLVALRADAATLASLLPELTAEPAAAASDFDAAYRLVAAVGRREGLPGRIVAVAHADTLDRCRKEGRAALTAWQAERAGAAPGAALPTQAIVSIDPQEPAATHAGADGGASPPARVPLDGTAIARAMLGQVFERPTLVARGSRLEVAFDTARVAAYRIVGHRQTAADALAAGGPPGLDLHAGEAARVVYEVMRRPRPAPGRGDLVSAMLEWEPAAADAAGGTAAGRVRRGLPEAIPPGLPDAAGCELVLAVALGELAAASVHAEPWRRFADGAAAVVSRWRARGDVTPTGQSLIHCLESEGIPSTAGGR